MFTIDNDNSNYYHEIDFKQARADFENYYFLREEELGRSIVRYNGGIRVDIRKERYSNIIKNEFRFLTVIRQISKESGIQPSFGLKFRNENRDEYIHFLLEFNDNTSIGVFYYDTKRVLVVPQIHTAERLIRQAGLKGGIIVANKIGMPAMAEAQRINKLYGEYGILTIEQYTNLEKRYFA